VTRETGNNQVYHNQHNRHIFSSQAHPTAMTPSYSSPLLFSPLLPSQARIAPSPFLYNCSNVGDEVDQGHQLAYEAFDLGLVSGGV
jgi:hypothetical protein